MDTNEKIIKLLIASGNVSEEKVEQARKLAESLKWENETPANNSVQATGGESVNAVNFGDHMGCPACGALLLLPTRA